METLNEIIKECQNRYSKCSLKLRNKPQTHIHKMNPKEKKVLIKKNKIIMNLQISGIVRIFAFGRSADFFESFVGVDSNVLHADLART